MAEDGGLTSAPGATPSGPTCPWCSAPLPAADAAVCPGCGAHLVEEQGGDIPGVTSVDPYLLAIAANPRKPKRTFGSLLVGEDKEIPPPSAAEMPALARPDAEVRREMLRLELEARLAALRAEAQAIEAEERGDAAVVHRGEDAGVPAGEQPGSTPPILRRILGATLGPDGRLTMARTSRRGFVRARARGRAG